MDFFQFNQTRLCTNLIVIWHLQCQNQPFVSHLLAKDSGPSIPSVVAILPNFDGFLIISSKLDLLYRFSRHPTRPMVVLTHCLPPARWGPRTLDFQCIGQIAWFRWMLSNFVKTRPFIQIQPPSDPSNGSFNPLSPTCTLRTQGPSILSVGAILPDFDGFLQISSKFDYSYRFSHNPSPTIQKFTVCLPSARWGPGALDSQCHGNIAIYRWISSNFNKTRQFIHI